MKRLSLNVIAGAVALGLAQSATAATGVFFNPLTQSTAVAQTANHINELNSPWQVPAGVSYRKLFSLHDIEADASQSTVRVPGLGASASMTDMSAFDPSGRYIFVPHETQYGAGLTRFDTVTGKAINLFKGDMNGATGNWEYDYGALDPATWTPVDTLLVAEEWSGQGRMFEVMNPMADVNAGEAVVVNELNSIPNVSHEGLRFNHKGSALYFVDEDRSGSIYKFVPSKKGVYTKGQSFVLKVDAYAGDASKNWNIDENASAIRTGEASWVPITDADGNALTASDPFDNASRGGRAAADDVNATPFGRPEDVEVGYLRNGNEALYFNATSEQAVYSVEELKNGKAMVRVAASAASTPTNLGYAPTTGTLSDPDNLAQDAVGNIYVVEDKPNGDAVGGDVWFLRDVDGDGVAESLDHFMSLQVKGAENTGMIFSPVNPTQFIINVQHPESTADQIDGQGDATWLIDLKDVVAPPCLDKDDDDYRHGYKHGVKTCDRRDSSNFINKLQRAGKSHRHH
jgi:hypothetical protein